MNSGLRNALVYLGLAEPAPRVGAEPPTAPISILRAFGLVVALCLGVGLAVAVLWVIGLSVGDLVPFGGGALILGMATLGRAIWERSRGGRTSD